MIFICKAPLIRLILISFCVEKPTRISLKIILRYSKRKTFKSYNKISSRVVEVNKYIKMQY